MNSFTIIRRNLTGRIARNIAMIFSVALVAALSTVFAAGRSFFKTADVMLEQPMIIVEPVYPYYAANRDADTPKLRGLPNFVALTRTQTHFASNKEGNYYFVTFGADDTYFTVFNSDGVWFPTTPDMVERWRKERTAFITGELTAQKMGFEVGRQYEIKTNGGVITGTCVGISKGGANKVNTVFHYEYVDEVLGKREGKVTRWIVQVSDRKFVDPTIEAVDAMFKDTTTPTSSIPAGEHVKALSAKKRSIVNMLGVVCVLILFVTLFITFNTVLFLVRERRQVLAAMRAIGFRSSRVFALVMAEVMALCLLGGVIGVGLVALYFRGGIPFGEGNLLVTVRPGAIGVGLGVTAAIGLFASIIPSWLAARVDIMEALRSN